MNLLRSKDQLKGMIISDTSIKQPVLVLMLILLVVVIGLLSYRSLPVNLIPDVSLPTIAVTVPYPGAGPESVAEQVAKPVEEVLNTLNGVKHLTSTSVEGRTQIAVQFDTSVNVDQALQDVRDKVNTVRPRLPRDVKDPVFQKFDVNDLPIMTLAVAGQGSRTPVELRRLIDDEIVPRLERVPGVGSVTVNGGQVRQINVQMELKKLTAYQLLPAQISQAIQTGNADRGMGTITAGQDISLRAPSMIQQPQDIALLPIATTPYRIGDVALIEDGVAPVDGYARLDGKDAITLEIRKQSGSNTVQVADGIRAAAQKIFAEHPDLSYTIPVDQSTFVRQSANGAIEELIVASLAAMLVVLLFFRDLRNTFVTILGLPIILIATFAAIKLFGLTINLISLLALTLSVGLVIDDAIVVRENTLRHMERGETPFRAASRATAQIATSVLAMTLTIVAVFLPVVFTSGITGIIFKSFGLTVASAMVISLFEAFMISPMLSAYLFKQQKPKQNHQPPKGYPPAGSTENREPSLVRGQVSVATADEQRTTDQGQPTAEQELLQEANEPLNALGRFYERLLAWSLRHRLLTVAIVALALVATIPVARGLKFSFAPQLELGVIGVEFDLAPGTPLEQTNQLAQRAETLLMSDPAVESVLATVGGIGNHEHAQFVVNLRHGQSSEQTKARLRPQLAFLPDLAFGQPSILGFVQFGVETRGVQLNVQTLRPLHELEPVLKQLQEQVQGVAGVNDVGTTYRPGKPELRFQLEPAKAGDLSLNNDQLSSSVRALINGDTATTFRQNGQDTDVVVRLKPGDRTGLDALRAISVPTRAGSVPLSALVTVEPSGSLTSIRRYERLNQAVIGANLTAGRNRNDVEAEISARLAQIQLPSGVFVSFAGSTEDQQEGFTSLLIAMGLGVLFIYMVLASQFGSLLQPIVIMFALPFSFIGAFIAVRLAGIDLDIFSMIGLIMLLALVTKNSILMVDFANRLREAGMDKHTALQKAGAIRLRPILMTTLALIAGYIPVVIGLGEGSELRRGLSIAVMGGLVSSTLLTLLFIPTAYSLLDSLTSRVGDLFWRRVPAPKPARAEASPAAVLVPSRVGDLFWRRVPAPKPARAGASPAAVLVPVVVPSNEYPERPGGHGD